MTYTVPAGRYGDYSTAFIQAYIDAKIAGVLDAAPEALDTLNELAAAIGDDASFLTTMSSANTTLQTNIDNLSTAAATARTTLQTLLQNAVDAVQADVDTNETTVLLPLLQRLLLVVQLSLTYKQHYRVLLMLYKLM